MAMSGCGGSGSESPPIRLPVAVERVFDFAQGSGGWISGQADYSAGTAPNDVVSESRALPAPFLGYGHYSAATNRSDDLLLYIKTRIGALVPGASYRVGAVVEFLTDVPSGCVGVGGAPGESVWIVVAASANEPLTVVDGSEFRLNLNRGNQSQGGPEGHVLGNIANTVVNCGSRRWETKLLSTPAISPLSVKADPSGQVWVVLGFDSGFESFSAVYYQRLMIKLTPV